MFAALLALAGTTPSPDVSLPKRPGGISLYRERVRIGERGQRLILHIYVVPKEKLNREGGPLRREDIRGGTSIETSPFFLELLDDEGGVPKRLSSVRFNEDGQPNQVEIRWVRPTERRAPVVLMRFGVGDEGEWLIASYPRGPSRRPTLQHLGFDQDEDFAFMPHFDGKDRRGNMMIWEEEWTQDRRKVHRYRWNGNRFSGMDMGSDL